MSGAETLRGSAVAIGASGLLIVGAAGAGKSALALALIARGAELVADDRTEVRGDGNAVHLAPPAPIAGLIEARGLGLLRLPHRADVRLALVADLDRPAPARLPPMATHRLHGCTVPLFSCRDCPGLADALFVLLSRGTLIDPDDDEVRT